jgi:hypothetical protein
MNPSVSTVTEPLQQVLERIPVQTVIEHVPPQVVEHLPERLRPQKKRDIRPIAIAIGVVVALAVLMMMRRRRRAAELELEEVAAMRDVEDPLAMSREFGASRSPSGMR